MQNYFVATCYIFFICLKSWPGNETSYRIAGKFRGVKIRSTRETVVFVSKNFV